jgi:hypothetical protein
MANDSRQSFFRSLSLAQQTAQRLGTMLENELEKALARSHQDGDLISYRELLKLARPYRYQESRIAPRYAPPRC